MRTKRSHCLSFFGKRFKASKKKYPKIPSQGFLSFTDSPKTKKIVGCITHDYIHPKNRGRPLLGRAFDVVEDAWTLVLDPEHPMPIPALKSPNRRKWRLENTTIWGAKVSGHIFWNHGFLVAKKETRMCSCLKKLPQVFLGSPKGGPISNPHQHIGPPPRGQQPPGCWIAKVAGRFYPASEAWALSQATAPR